MAKDAKAGMNSPLFEKERTMDKNWSEMNKEMQALLSKEATFPEGIKKLFALRKSLFEQITKFKRNV